MKKAKSLITLISISFGAPLPGDEEFPIISADFKISVFAQDPLVRNPCAITFDQQGRLCVGMGPQYRSPTKDTPGDSVWILSDEDSDGEAESRKQFATGFNSIQGLAWKGQDLWVANAPDLTIVRDLNGDDIADEYTRVYTDLGNLEHGLHGLNFGPDGKLYMSKGNSKGLTEPPERVAPAPFRELWGIADSAHFEDPTPIIFTSETYKKNYHNPRDDWGISGGILRCKDDGSQLEIISRGFRNPWDIAFDDRFDWLGTDNDQTMGDKIIAPFFGSHFGWGHAWSFDWKGDGHLPTAPSSGPLFEGSGTGIVFCKVPGYPEKYQNVFFYNDWLNRETRIYRTKWDGAWRKADRENLEILAHAEGGRTMPKSSGRSFDPVDIEIGPDGAIWISSWGRQYGAHFEEGKIANEGRIYRLWPRAFSPSNGNNTLPVWGNASAQDLIGKLGSHLPVWRTNAQEELIRRGKEILPLLLKRLSKDGNTTSLETWLIWTIGRISPDQNWFDLNTNQKIQSLRLQAFHQTITQEVVEALNDPEPRVRLEAVLTLRQGDAQGKTAALIDLASRETDRIVFYATWGALMELMPEKNRRDLLDDERASIRLAAFLGLLEQDALSEAEIKPFLNDPSPLISGLAKKRLGGKYQFEHRGKPLTKNRALQKQTGPIVIPFSNLRASSGNKYRAGLLQIGAQLYTDRGYSITQIPPELEQLTFIQTACSDADAQNDFKLSFSLSYPSTVYLIDDARGEALPDWAKGKWKKTSLLVNSTNPKRLKVYEAELPAGHVEFGANRDGLTARKGGYLIAVRPKLLKPDGSISDESSILPLLENANTRRGRDLFFSTNGANCSSCHQVGQLGNNHAPDLSEIGSRADAKSLIQSIIDPSANIVEGFYAQTISMKNGQTHAGVILQERTQSLTLATPGGGKITIQRNEIESQKRLLVSAMPAGFSASLTSQQIADLTAYLLTLKKPKVISKDQTQSGSFKFQLSEDKLELSLGKQPITTYLLDHEILSRRAFINLKSRSGKPVTRNFPPKRPEDLSPGYKGKGGVDHPVMHPGLWISFGWLDGQDYWRLKSKVQFESFLEKPSVKQGVASFSTRDRYLDEQGQKTICLQDSHYRFQETKDGILLNWDTTFYNNKRDFSFGDQEESGLGLRIASPLRVEGGNGQILNNRGEKNGAQTWGKNFQWIDYSGEIAGDRVGVIIAPHPENPLPTWSHSRDYGVLVSNPFVKQPKERREPYQKTLIKKGQKLRLRYAILIHDGNHPISEMANAILIAR